MKYTLYEQTSLLYNRHLDQILLCALYGVCKVNKLPITFKEILHHYRDQPQYNPETYRTVIIRQTNPGFEVPCPFKASFDVQCLG